ncbi:MAG: F0F1 ATP synthase subunit delta [Clostridiales bacterium]|nr:F0F1 ATP synthase subunit delta [Clostridiales bacterium]
MAKLVSKVYGDALFETAMESGRMDVFYEEAQGLIRIFDDNPQMTVLLNHPRISKEEKTAVMHQIFSGKVQEEMTSFLKLVVEKERQDEIVPILRYFIGQVREYKKIGTVNVTSAAALSAKQKETLEKKLLATTSYKKFEMSYQVDTGLIGGMVIRIGDRVVDSSIRTRLYQLKKELSALQLSQDIG